MSEYPEELLARARRVKLLLLDVDGVLTDGRVILGPDGMELKAFNSQDGFGLKRLGENGVACGVITGRGSAALQRRARELGFRHLVENTEDKLPAFEAIIKKEGLTAEECAYMGDDWPDLPLLCRVGLALAPANAAAEVKRRAHFVTERAGGAGAAREACELILKAQGRFDSLLAKYDR